MRLTSLTVLLLALSFVACKSSNGPDEPASDPIVLTSFVYGTPVDVTGRWAISPKDSFYLEISSERTRIVSETNILFEGTLTGESCRRAVIKRNGEEVEQPIYCIRQGDQLRFMVLAINADSLVIQDCVPDPILPNTDNLFVR